MRAGVQNVPIAMDARMLEGQSGVATYARALRAAQQTINPNALVSVKVSTPTDCDMVAVGSYYAGTNIIHFDGKYGGTGAAPDISKKNKPQST